MHAYWGGGFGFWWIVPVLFGLGWLVLFALLLWRVLRPGAWPAGRWHAPDALDTLRDRFARGEIDAEEYERRRELLQRR